MPDPNDPTPGTTITATPPSTTTVAAEPVVEATGTVTPSSGEAIATNGQAAPAEETFTDVDVKSLPPKERAAYDNMLRDYKRKTAEVAEIRRKAEAFDAWQTQQAAERAKVTDEDFNRAFESKEGFQSLIEKAANPVVQKLNATEKELRETKADLFVKDFKAKHTDFDDLDSDGLITGFVQLNRPSTEAEWGPTVKAAYDYAKKLRSKWEEAGYKRGMARVQEKAEGSTEMPSGSPAPVYTGPDPKNLTAEQAVELAMKGIRVPQH
jgi:hypothetical protein